MESSTIVCDLTANALISTNIYSLCHHLPCISISDGLLSQTINSERKIENKEIFPCLYHAASGQLIPAALALIKYSATVVRETWQLLAISLTLRPWLYFRRRTSLTLCMGNLLFAIQSPPFGECMVFRYPAPFLYLIPGVAALLRNGVRFRPEHAPQEK